MSTKLPQRVRRRNKPIRLPSGGMSEAVTLIEENPDRVSLSIAFELLTQDGYQARDTYLYLLINYQESDGIPGPENCDERIRVGQTISWSQGRDTVPTGRIVGRYVDFDTSPDPTDDFTVRAYDLSNPAEETSLSSGCDF